MDDVQTISRKLRKCQALASDTRGDPTTRATAARQAALLLERLEALTVAALPKPTETAWGPYWATRTTADAMRAGITTRALCRDGWFIPG